MVGKPRGARLAAKRTGTGAAPARLGGHGETDPVRSTCSGTGPFTGNPWRRWCSTVRPRRRRDGRISHWLNYSETVFVGPPTDPAAGLAPYGSSPSFELPFAGHPIASAPPTPGSPAARRRGDLVQECGIGLVTCAAQTTAASRSPRRRSAPARRPPRICGGCRQLRVDPVDVQRAEWVDNGPGWLRSSSPRWMPSPGRPAPGGKVGVLARCGADDPDRAAIEARLLPGRRHHQDPVTGSPPPLVGLVGDGTLTAPYRARELAARSPRPRGRHRGRGRRAWVGGATHRVRGADRLIAMQRPAGRLLPCGYELNATAG